MAANPDNSLEPPRGLHEHDGFYLRMGIGFGRLYAKMHSDDSAQLGGSVDGSLAGGGLSAEFSLGGTIAPGLVLGGGFWGIGAGNPGMRHLEVGGASHAPLTLQSAGLGLLGPFVDYYLNPKTGLHFQGALGLGTLNVTRSITDASGHIVEDKKQAGGLGFMLGAGYEWWVGEQWSIGGILRMVYVSTETNGNDNTERWSYIGLAAPELLFVATYQ
jgi:hypothetical protein